MNENQYADAKHHFNEAKALAPEARSAYLDALAPRLRADVQAFLEADDELDDGFMQPLANLNEIMGNDPLIGTQVGAFRLDQLLGEGGMGRVYAASRADGAFQQQVALKVVKKGMDTAAVLRRFEAERRILARLRHPGIARLVGGGETEDGRPYVAMELVDGEKLTDYADRFALDVRGRVQLMLQVCEAVAHAHRHLVVHRDLKPSNILVETDASGRPTVKLLDFGIARLLEGDPDDALTLTGQRPMTRPYGAPEQVRGGEITTATDVWALGVLLYQLLAGQRPFRADDQKGLETAILEIPPTLPSTAAARGETSTASGDARRLRGDLDAVCLTALAKEPERRYANADAFAADLRRYLDDLPVEARPPAASYRIRKFVSRHRAAVAVASLAGLVLLASATFYTTRLAAERDRAEAALAEAETAADFLQSVFITADPFETTRRDTLRLSDLIGVATERIGSELTDTPALQGRLYTTVGAAYGSQAKFAEGDSLFRLATARLEGRPSLPLAYALHRHAGLLVAWGGEEREDEAIALYRRAFDTYESIGGGATQEREIETAISAYNIAIALRRRREMAEAERFFQDALNTFERYDIPDTTSYAVILGQYAVLQGDLGRDQDAVSNLEKALALLEAQLGPDHPHVGVEHYLLGGALLSANRQAEALDHFRQSFAIDSVALGLEHPNTLDALQMQGVALHELGQSREGVRLLRRAVETLERVHGPEDPRLPFYLQSYAAPLLALGRYDEADRALARALPLMTEIHGDDHWGVGAIRGLQGRAALARGDTQAALPLLRDAMQRTEAGFGPQHLRVNRARVALAEGLLATGEREEAAKTVRPAAEAFAQRYGADAAQTREARALLRRATEG